MDNLFLFVLLSGAAWTDVRYHRIKNIWLLVFLALGLLLRIPEGITELAWGLVLICIPMLCLYIVYAVGGIGAGDVKLLCVVAVYLKNSQEVFRFIAIVFLWSAVFAIAKCAYQKDLKIIIQRLFHFCSYLKDIFLFGQVQEYDALALCDEKLGHHQIHLSIPVLITGIMYMGGFYF